MVLNLELSTSPRAARRTEGRARHFGMLRQEPGERGVGRKVFRPGEQRGVEAQHFRRPLAGTRRGACAAARGYRWRSARRPRRLRLRRDRYRQDATGKERHHHQRRRNRARATVLCVHCSRYYARRRRRFASGRERWLGNLPDAPANHQPRPPGSDEDESALDLKRLIPVLMVAGLIGPALAQSRPDPDINARIREEENTHSQIMRTLHFLTDVYGPRVTGSPNLESRRRMGDQDDGVVGIHQRPSRASGTSAIPAGSTSAFRRTSPRRSRIS